MSTLEVLSKTLTHLRQDGLFVKVTPVPENMFLIETTTYVTDIDDGQDIDCLCVHEDDLGLGGSCVCEDITTGNWIEDYPEGQVPRGCVACPVCERLTKPWKLQKRCYSLMVTIKNDCVTFLDSRPISTLKVMPEQMIGKIIGLCNARLREVLV
jgi:hypothetical protein